jgi:NAD(P)-dependent dehydrogenase (short-subunit alcohol dehydrogenase family)
MTGILDGRCALITGASQGLGREIARAFVSEGASVFLCARQAEALSATVEELAELARDGQTVDSRPADVADRAQVEDLVAAATARFPRLSVVVSNAGVYGPMGNIEDIDWDDWVQTIEINLLGSVMLARAVVPHLRSVGHGKFIQISGGGATSPMPRISAYAASKAAVVRFAETLALELADAHIDVNSVAPGAMNTRMLDEVLKAGPERVGQAYYDRCVAQRESGGTPPSVGADLSVWLASAASDGITGKLISAVWDPWRELESRRADLEGDVYTLRRIIPADRGLSWDG